MKIIIALTISVCASVAAQARQAMTAPSPSPAPRPVYRHRVRRTAVTTIQQAAQPAPVDFLIGDAKVNLTTDATVVRLAMAQHGSVLIELPANDGPRYIIPGDPDLATVDEKALERNKRAIVVRPGSLFVPPLPNRKARTPAATVTAQMRSGLVVTFLFYPVEDLAQNVHRCVLHYNRDEVVARRRAAGLPVNLDTNVSQERRIETGQSTAPISISVDDTDENKATEKPAENKTALTAARHKSNVDVPATPSATTPKTEVAEVTTDSKPSEKDERVATLTHQALMRAIKKPKQFKNWTKPAHGIALSILRQSDPKSEFQVLMIAVKNTGNESLKLVPGGPDLLVEMLDDRGKSINLESIKKLHTEVAEANGTIAAGATVYYAIAYVEPVLGARQQIRVVVGQTNAADEPASIALPKYGK